MSTSAPQVNKDENLLAEPAKFCYACKQAAREAAVGKGWMIMFVKGFYRVHTPKSSSFSSDLSTPAPQIKKDENLLAEPAKFCYACKQAAREAAVGKG